MAVRADGSRAQPPRGIIGRPHLATLVDASPAPVIGVWAPAGFGKTTLLTAWAARRPSRPVTWVDLAGDPDGVAAELRRAAASTPRGAVVVDDAHLLTDPAALDALADLAATAGAGSELLLAGRHEPGGAAAGRPVGLRLDRLRADGRIDELTAGPLRLSADEIAALLVERGLDAAPDLVAAVLAGTEGWPAGVALVAEGIRRAAGTAPALGRVGAVDRFTGEFVEHDVLGPLAPDVRAFVEATAWFERFVPELVDEVLERGDATTMIARLEDLQLLDIADEAGTLWYRLPQLVVDHLRSPRHPDAGAATRRSELHLRAAAWFEREGLPDDSVAHVMASGDFEQAARHAIRQLRVYDRQGDAGAVRRWFDRMPHRVRQARSTQVAIAWSLIQAGAPLDAITLLDAEPLEPNSITADDAEALLVRAFAQRMLFRHDEVLAATRQALRVLDGLDLSARRDAYLRLLAVNQTVDVLAWRHRIDDAKRLAERAGTFIEPSGNTLATPRQFGLLALMAFDRGQLRVARRYAADGLSAGKTLDRLDQHAAAEATLAAALLAREAGDADEAVRLLRRTLALGAAGRWPTTNARALLELSELADADEAAASLDRAGRLDELARDPVLADRTELAVVARLVNHGDRAAAGRLRRLAAHDLSAPDRSRLVLLALAADAPAVAAGQLPALRRGAHLPRVQVASGLAQAADAAARGDDGAAIDALGEALAIAEANDLAASLTGAVRPLRTLLERVPTDDAALLVPSPAYLDELLTRCGPPAAAAVFSVRELDVVPFIPTRLMAEEIAAELFISTNTVKTHLRNIYRKLGVANRNEAARRLEELQLVEHFIRHG